MKELTLNREKFNAIVEKMISNIKERMVRCVNFELDFNGLFEDQIYYLNAVDFIDGLAEEKDNYLAIPRYTDNHLSGIFLTDDYSDNDDWLPSIEIQFEMDHLGRIRDEIKERKDKLLTELDHYVEMTEFEDIEDGVLSFLNEDTKITGYFHNRDDYCIFVNRADQDIIIESGNEPGNAFKFDDPEVEHWMTLWNGLYSFHLKNKATE